MLIRQLLTDADQGALRLDSRQLSSTPGTDTLDTTIGDHNNLDLGNALLGQLDRDLEEVLTVRGHGGFAQENNGLLRANLVTFNGNSLGGVTHVVSSVDLKVGDVTRLTELDGGKVNVAGRAGALGLPAVRHIVATAGEEHVGGVTVVCVGQVSDDRSSSGRGQVVDLVLVLGVDLVDVSVDTETGNTTIGVHAEANVGIGLGGGLLELEAVAGVGVKGDLGQDGGPGDLGPLLVGAGSSLGRGGLGVTLDGDEGGVVAGEVGGIDLKSGNVSGVAELDNAPVVVGGVVAAGLPAIVPGSGGDEATGGRDGGGGSQEVGAIGEPLVGESENLASTGSNSKICLLLSPSVGWLSWVCVVELVCLVDRSGGVRVKDKAVQMQRVVVCPFQLG